MGVVVWVWFLFRANIAFHYETRTINAFARPCGRRIKGTRGGSRGQDPPEPGRGDALSSTHRCAPSGDWPGQAQAPAQPGRVPGRLRRSGQRDTQKIKPLKLG